MGDPNRALFQQANIRAQSGHRKSGIVTAIPKDARASVSHGHHAIHANLQTVGKSVIAFNKGKKLDGDLSQDQGFNPPGFGKSSKR
jgi:hypothetical protein